MSSEVWAQSSEPSAKSDEGVALGTQRGRPLRTSMWIAVDSAAEIGAHTAVMAAEYIGVCPLHPGSSNGEVEYLGGSPLAVVMVRSMDELENGSCRWNGNLADYSRGPGREHS